MRNLESITTTMPRRVVAVRVRSDEQWQLPDLPAGFGVLVVAFDPDANVTAVQRRKDELRDAVAHPVVGCGGPGADLWEPGILAVVGELRSPGHAVEFYFGSSVIGFGAAVSQFVVLCVDGDDDQWRELCQTVRAYLASHVDWRLHAAADAGREDEVRRAIADGWPLEEFDDDLAWTPLHHAANAGHVEIVRLLLAAGVDVERHCVERTGDTALATVAEGCSPAMAGVLVQAGADPRVPGWMGLRACDRVQRRTDPDAEAVQRILAAGSPGLGKRARG